MKYNVTWYAVVDAKSPIDAARIAEDILVSAAMTDLSGEGDEGSPRRYMVTAFNDDGAWTDHYHVDLANISDEEEQAHIESGGGIDTTHCHRLNENGPGDAPGHDTDSEG